MCTSSIMSDSVLTRAVSTLPHTTRSAISRRAFFASDSRFACSMCARCTASFSCTLVRPLAHRTMVWRLTKTRATHARAAFGHAMAAHDPVRATSAGAPAPAAPLYTDTSLDDVLAMVDEHALERDESVDPMALLAYYRRLLPFRSLFTWLNQDVALTRSFTHREFAFTLQNDAYLRYQSFSSWDEWKREVCRLNPSRFEIGPVYSAKPKDRKTMQKASFRPVERELVFDIDMTDYDEIRTCCSDKQICARCWKLIAVAVEVLDSVLREDFGFRHIVWVYSGRRGIHCWVSDPEARALPDEARKALVGWTEVIRGSANQTKKVALGNAAPGAPRVLHPSLRRALGAEVVANSGSQGTASAARGPLQRAFFDVILTDQDVFRERARWETLLALLPANESEAVARLEAKWAAAPRSSVRKWDDVLETASKSAERVRPAWVAAIEDIVLQYTYPRIDAEVSKRQNHLLKSPFVVHPSTGRVCVPLEVEQIQHFDPHSGAPTVAQLLRELNRHKAQHAASSPAAPHAKGEWEKTSLRPFVEQFDRATAKLLREVRDAKRGTCALLTQPRRSTRSTFDVPHPPRSHRRTRRRLVHCRRMQTDGAAPLRVVGRRRTRPDVAQARRRQRKYARVRRARARRRNGARAQRMHVHIQRVAQLLQAPVRQRLKAVRAAHSDPLALQVPHDTLALRLDRREQGARRPRRLLGELHEAHELLVPHRRKMRRQRRAQRLEHARHTQVLCTDERLPLPRVHHGGERVAERGRQRIARRVVGRRKAHHERRGRLGDRRVHRRRQRRPRCARLQDMRGRRERRGGHRTGAVRGQRRQRRIGRERPRPCLGTHPRTAALHAKPLQGVGSVEQHVAIESSGHIAGMDHTYDARHRGRR